YVSGQLLAFIAYAWRYAWTFRTVSQFRAASVLGLARSQSSFPCYSLPAAVLRSFALSTPNFALAYVESTGVAGDLSRAQSLLALPIGLVGIALAQVFQEKASRERAQSGSCWNSYKRLFVALAVASPPTFAVLALAAPQLFVLYLGEQWKDTGHVAQ